MIFHVAFTSTEDGVTISDRSALIRDISNTLGMTNFHIRLLTEKPDEVVAEVTIPSELISPSFRDYLKSLPNWKYVDFLTKFEEMTVNEDIAESNTGTNSKESEIIEKAKAARELNWASTPVGPEGFDLRRTVLDETERDIQRRERLLKREKEKMERMRIRDEVVRSERAKWEKDILRGRDSAPKASNMKYLESNEESDKLDREKDDDFKDTVALEDRINLNDVSENSQLGVSEVKIEEDLSGETEDEPNLEEEEDMHDNLSDYEFCEYVLKSGRRYGDLSDKDKLRFNKGLSEHKTFGSQGDPEEDKKSEQEYYRNPKYMEFRPKPVRESEMITEPNPFDEKRTMWTELTGSPEIGRSRRNTIQ